ncbi:MAG: RHS repeat-associated core domain-containing protein, partial [Candidatus Electrothrix sp. AX1]|nr:RHS repeat-associated core domain-containing protein [Candidatus Electrothrix sp. AX1]
VWCGGTTTTYLYDGDNVIGDSVAGSLVKSYVTPFLDQNVSMTDTASGKTYYYSQDGLGSVRTLADSGGVVQNAYDYTAFGETFAANTVVNVGQRYAYTGREKTSNTDMMYYRWRMYDSGVGRFVHRDPAQSPVWNLYGYVVNNVINGNDPFGLREMKHPPANLGRIGAMGGNTGNQYWEGTSPDSLARTKCSNYCVGHAEWSLGSRQNDTPIGNKQSTIDSRTGTVRETERKGSSLYYYVYELTQKYQVDTEKTKSDYKCECKDKDTICYIPYMKVVKTKTLKIKWVKRVGDVTWFGPISGTYKEILSGQVY